VRYENVFVLSPGRSGSKSFVEASKHLSNYSASHESRGGKLGEERFAYPQFHIEADNRLCWFLGPLSERFKDKEVLYVHLKRDFDATVDSFLHRLRNSTYRSSIIDAFAHGVLMKPGDWTPKEEVEVVRLYVSTIHSNIELFLSSRNSIKVELGDNGSSFDLFLDQISAEGDLTLTRNTWQQIHNAR
jgi:hypothetical protein